MSATPEYSREYRRRKREHPEEFFCDCSRPGVAVSENGVVCEACLRIEKSRMAKNRDDEPKRPRVWLEEYRLALPLGVNL